MSGTLSIPNAFAAQGGNVPASQLDTDFSTIANYVNAREITVGLLSARPAAGTAGQWYLATDVNGGTLYTDNGSAWVQAAAPAVASKIPFNFCSSDIAIPAASIIYINAANASVTEGVVSMRFPFAATLSNLRCNSSNVPGASRDFNYVVRVNAASTALTCRTSGAGSSGSEDLTHSVSITAGTALDLELTTSTGSNACVHWATLQVDPA